MARTKKLNIVVDYVNTPYIINDLGEAKTPRFELYNTETKDVTSRSDDPRDFDEIVYGGVQNV